MISITPEYLRPRLLHRDNNTHKHDYGRLLIVAGCESMPGAAVLATGGALRSGCGLVRLHSTGRALQAAANAYPSAMLSDDFGEHFSTLPEHIDRYSAIAIPGCRCTQYPLRPPGVARAHPEGVGPDSA